MAERLKEAKKQTAIAKLNDVPTSPRKMRRWSFAAAALVVFALSAGAVFWFRRPKTLEPLSFDDLFFVSEALP